jgi:hypothetical protein
MAGGARPRVAPRESAGRRVEALPRAPALAASTRPRAVQARASRRPGAPGRARSGLGPWSRTPRTAVGRLGSRPRRSATRRGRACGAGLGWWGQGWTYQHRLVVSASPDTRCDARRPVDDASHTRTPRRANGDHAAHARRAATQWRQAHDGASGAGSAPRAHRPGCHARRARPSPVLCEGDDPLASRAPEQCAANLLKRGRSISGQDRRA